MRIKNRARSFMQVRRSRSKRGVSPVIGVILMVAATIVIAGVVMAMLGGFGPPSKTYSVAASAEERYIGGNLTITVTYQGGPDHSMVDYITATVDGTAITGVSGWGTADGSSADVTLGSSGNTAQATAGSGNNHVVVSATFIDGTSQVILDTWV